MMKNILLFFLLALFCGCASECGNEDAHECKAYWLQRGEQVKDLTDEYIAWCCHNNSGRFERQASCKANLIDWRLEEKIQQKE